MEHAKSFEAEGFERPNVLENKSTDLHEKLLKQGQAMAHFALQKGLAVPSKLVEQLQQEQTQTDIASLTKAHNQLAELVAPAMPETILMMAQEQEKQTWFLFLGRVPLIRKMMLVAIISLITLISLSLSSYINNDNMVASMFDMEGARLLYVQAILLASAAIGASFSALFKANIYVTAGCFDAKYESSYWVRFVVGLISGIILTQLIPINLDAVAKTAEQSTGMGGGMSHAALKITMALVGGFSANLVYTILDRIVDTAQSFISPQQPEDLQTVKQSLLNQFKSEQLEYEAHLSQELMAIQQQVASSPSMSSTDFQQLLSQYLAKIIRNEEK